MDDSVVYDIVDEIATREGIDPGEFDEPLQTVVDVDAVDALVNDSRCIHDQGCVRVAFEYYGYEVTVDDQRRVEVEALPAATDGASTETSSVD